MPFTEKGAETGSWRLTFFTLIPPVLIPVVGLVRAWWNDTGFAGRCPKCGGWIHFTIREKRAISGHEASQLPQLPDDWHSVALVL